MACEYLHSNHIHLRIRSTPNNYYFDIEKLPLEMSSDDLLRGACSCGRYKYAVLVPSDATAKGKASVHFGTSDLDRMA